MFVGIIKTRDILMNPRTIISMRGVRGFMKLVYRALRKQPYSFIGMTQESDWIFDQNVQEQLQKDQLEKEGKIQAAPSPKSEAARKKHASPKRHEVKKHGR
jgi:hypothetical protein